MTRILHSETAPILHRLRRPIALAAWVLVTTLLLLLGPARGTPAVLWPSAAAVALAFVTREIYSSLFLGALGGAILLRGGDLLEAGFFGWIDLFSVHMIGALTSRWNISILTFTLMMGGLVELLHRNGSMQALASTMLGKGSSPAEATQTRAEASRLRAGLSVFAMGWLVFFDGLANSMLVGKTMRATADRAGLSREKLAFIVDSTSSPIASVALVSTWIVTEMSLIREGLEHLPAPLTDASVAVLSPYGLLLQSLPYRFYAYFLLLMVFFVIWQQRDIGPMYAAERRALAVRPEDDRRSGAGPPGSPRGRIWLAVLPLLVLVLGVFGGLYVQGGGLQEAPSLRNTIEALGRAQADLVFVCACASAVLVALLLSWFASLGGTAEHGDPSETRFDGMRIFFDGMQQMFLPVLILVFAWTLNSVIVELGTADYLVQAIDGRLPGALLPAAVFVVAAVISFSTGTSWGTMAIVVPLVIPLAAELARSVQAPLLPVSIGAVLAGAVFGDHCSPISDTTLVSAFASGCEPMDHVRTQIPYALAVATIAVGLGYLPAALGISVWLLLPAGGIACWIFLRTRGRSIVDG